MCAARCYENSRNMRGAMPEAEVGTLRSRLCGQKTRFQPVAFADKFSGHFAEFFEDCE